MLQNFLFFLVFSLWRSALFVRGQGNWTTTPFNPMAMPLAVKHPYVNAWVPLGFGTTGSDPLYQQWPNTFTIANVGLHCTLSIADGLIECRRDRFWDGTRPYVSMGRRTNSWALRLSQTTPQPSSHSFSPQRDRHISCRLDP